MLTMPMTAAALLVSPQSLENEILHAEEEIQKIPPPAWVAGRTIAKKVVRAVRSGTTFNTIVQYAHAHAIDLIVIGTHGRTGLSHVLLGSIAERVVRYAHCSVLTVHSEQHAKVAKESERLTVLEPA